MSQYRIFTIGPNGHFISGTAMACLNDEQAIEAAQCMLNGHDLELWQGPRFVITLKHKETPDHGRLQSGTLERSNPERPKSLSIRTAASARA
jgi:hypothetical protein